MSGCGKTTLISVLAGVLLREGGVCSVLEHDYNQMTQEETHNKLRVEDRALPSVVIIVQLRIG